MSQTQEDLNHQGTTGEAPDAAMEGDAREFDEGFDLPADNSNQDSAGEAPDGAPHSGDEGAGSQPGEENEPAQPGQREEPAPVPQVLTQPEPQPAPQPQPVPQGQQPTEPKQLESVPEEIVDEIKELEAISPAAAKLALEDSPEGAAVRERLVNYGAAMAQDRAEFVLARRDQAHKEATDEARRNAAAVRAHNENFLGAIKRELPDYFALLNDPARRADAARYQQEVYGWIASKPYSEAVPLMKIAQSGRDVNQVVSLLKQFENERRGGKNKPDPTGALAVPGRGAPTAPAGLGDKDDFDAGWNMK